MRLHSLRQTPACTAQLQVGQVIHVLPDKDFQNGVVMGVNDNVEHRTARPSERSVFLEARWMIYIDRVVNRKNFNKAEWQWIPWEESGEGVVCHVTEIPEAGDIIEIEQVCEHQAFGRVYSRRAGV